MAWRSVILLGAAGLGIGSMLNAQSSASDTMAPGVMTNMARHHQVMMYGVPSRYRKYRNPIPQIPAQLRRGAAIFQRNCASCHGLNGLGDGPAARQIASAPANLSWLAHTPMSKSDPYMYWTIAEGGQPFGSDMPAFKKSLSRTDIWAVIRYIQYGPSAP